LIFQEIISYSLAETKITIFWAMGRYQNQDPAGVFMNQTLRDKIFLLAKRIIFKFFHFSLAKTAFLF